LPSLDYLSPMWRCDPPPAVALQVESKFTSIVSDLENRSASMPGMCSACHQPAETHMCITEIPYFKELIIMNTQCDHCGYRNVDVRTAGLMLRLQHC